MATKHAVSGSITITPIWYDELPHAQVGLDDKILYDDHIETEQKICFNDNLDQGNHRLWVRFSNKKDNDTKGNLDKAIVVDKIDFFGIDSKRFVWQGLYEPIYPQQMLQQSKQLESKLRYHNYLGWNGLWYLDFSSPIFTWIHQVESLGWIYD